MPELRISYCQEMRIQNGALQTIAQGISRQIENPTTGQLQNTLRSGCVPLAGCLEAPSNS